MSDELAVDLFAGGGGASCGIESALERHVDIAINHDPIAMAVHQKNHPNTKHFVSNVWEVDPRMACGRRPVGLLWASPDCTFHSRARGGKPLERKAGSKRRALASVVIRWASTVRPRLIVMENVQEFEDWGPLTADGRPDKTKAGRSFRCWLGKLKAQGYEVEWRNLVAADYGTPTTRKRLFLIARCDGLPIVWPEPSHGKGREKPWRAAAEIIDFSRLGRSIFDRKKPLAEATMRRIAAGLERYVLKGKPFIVPVRHQGDTRIHDVEEPLRTVTSAHRGEFALCAPVLVGTGGPSYAGKPCGVSQPIGTVLQENHRALVQPFLVPVKTWGGGGNNPRSVEEPMRTITTSKRGEHALCQAFVVRTDMHKSNSRCVYDATDPLRTITTGGGFAVATTFVVRTAHGEKNAKNNRKRWGRGHASTTEPLGTVCSSGTDFALCAPVLVQTGYGERVGQAPRALDIEQPLGTVVSSQKHAVVTPILVTYYGQSKAHPVTAPLGTASGCVHHGLVTPFLTKYHGGEHQALRAHSCEEPLRAQDTANRFGLVEPIIAPVIVKAYGGGDNGRPAPPKPVTEPTSSITSVDHHWLTCAWLTKYYGTCNHGAPVTDPLPTISSGGGKGGGHAALVRAFLVKYYTAGGRSQTAKVTDPLPTVVCKERFGLVTIDGEDYEIQDIRLRMLDVDELAGAQGFAPEYDLSPARTKEKGVALVGNSVCQQVAEAIIRDNARAPGGQRDLFRYARTA
jgi:DNA (cytosine-5)-methyltransferase 1